MIIGRLGKRYFRISKQSLTGRHISPGIVGWSGLRFDVGLMSISPGVRLRFGCRLALSSQLYDKQLDYKETYYIRRLIVLKFTPLDGPAALFYRSTCEQINTYVGDCRYKPSVSICRYSTATAVAKLST